MDAWLLMIVGMVIGIPAGVLGSIIFYKYQKLDAKKEIEPKVSISQNERDTTIYGQLVNNGQEDIAGLAVELRWQQDGKEEKRIESRFFRPEDNPSLSSSENIAYLKKGQDVRLASIPQVADDNIIRVVVSGTGQDSGRNLHVVGEIKVRQRVRMIPFNITGR